MPDDQQRATARRAIGRANAREPAPSSIPYLNPEQKAASVHRRLLAERSCAARSEQRTLPAAKPPPHERLLLNSLYARLQDSGRISSVLRTRAIGGSVSRSSRHHERRQVAALFNLDVGFGLDLAVLPNVANHELMPSQ
jgi:hypothetical protein